jgi:formamidopyrimidine-DNA glycosylase
LIFQDTRYFGRLHLNPDELEGLGPEPLSREFSVAVFATALKRSKQPIKVRLLDQTLVAGIGNIYASEALFRAGIPPRKPARRLTHEQVAKLHAAIRTVLRRAIRFGSTIPLDWSGRVGADGIFYYGSSDLDQNYEERLDVYDREGEPCRRCRTPIRRIVQAARGTFFCMRCQMQ